MEKKDTSFKLFVVIAYIITVAIFMLFYMFQTEGSYMVKVTAIYPSLLAPEVYFYVIWYLIFLMMTAFTVYQIKIYTPIRSKIKPEVMKRVRIIFMIICALFILMLVAWRFDYLALYAVLTLVLLLSVRTICRQLSLEELSRQDYLFIRLPYSILYGWLIYSTVLSFVILLVSIRWKALGLPIPLWAISTLIVLCVYVIYRSQKNKDIAYCMTIIWAYIGILVRHLDKNGLDGRYLQIIAVTIICCILLAGNSFFLLFSKIKKYNRNKSGL